MPILFPSDEWAKTLASQLNNSAKFAEAYKSKNTDMYLAVEPEGALKEPAYIYLHFAHGKVVEACMVRNRADKKPAYVFSASLGVWRRLMEHTLHPVVATVKRQIKVEGNMIDVMRDARIIQAIEDDGGMDVVFPE